ncbi:MAG: hypothetical protein RBT68_06505 [Spirochaetia bacterium]|nr:hypothetical protein [Spirochaetia bacterium]
MKRILICTMTILFALTAAFADEAPADPETLFLDILSVMLSENEMADISGGDVEVVVVLNNDYSGTATITVTPRYDNGKPALVDKSTYTVAVHNRVTGTAVEDKRRNDFYITDNFPEGTHTITGVSTAPAAYGNSRSEWVTTDATRVVLASKTSQDKQLTGATYERQDSGYYWHNNENYDFSASKSHGCIVSTKSDMDKVAATIAADSNPKSRKTITVVQTAKTTRERAPVSRAAGTASAASKPAHRISKPLLR